MPAHQTSVPQSDQPLVSLVMPVLNEAPYLSAALDAIADQTYPHDRIEIVIVDGGSSDATLDIARMRAGSDHRIRILGGAGVNTPAAVNLGAGSAMGAYVAKIDGHGIVNPEFVSEAVTTLRDESIGCVGPLVVPIATTDTQRAIALARFSRFGVGGGVYTAARTTHDADTVQCGVYRHAALLQSGGFDPDLPFGEDEELNYRIRLAGWRISLNPAMQYSYHVRPTIRGLFRQYFRYGRARVAVVRKHPAFLRPKHALPAILVVVLAASIAAIAADVVKPLAVLSWLAYFLWVLLGAGSLSLRSRFLRLDLIAASLVALHIGYGIGSLVGLVRLRRVERRETAELH
jgi:glycosyltransferase involved in cell wall biosynthesis